MAGQIFSCCQTVHAPRLGLGFKASAISPENHESDAKKPRNPRLLCLHGYRTSGRILRAQINKWPESVLRNLDLDFLDGPFPAAGKSDVEALFNPPYYEWYWSNKDYTEHRYFEEGLAYLEDYMLKHGPFDGLLGFSQGAVISAAAPGMQEQAVALTKVPKVKFLVIISGGKYSTAGFKQPEPVARAFVSPVRCPSLHFIGEKDIFRGESEDLVESFVEPVVIRHRRGHVVPRLDTKAEETTLSFLKRVRVMLGC